MVIMSGHLFGVAFGILGNIISVLVFLAPVPTFYRIYKKKTTESFQSLPYQVALFSSMLWLYYALMKRNAFLLVTINSFGSVIETIYIAIYVSYATKKSRMSALRLFVSMNLAVFSLILILTQFLIKGRTRVQVLGWVCVAVSVSVFAAPLNILARVIRTKSVEFMPFTLSFFLTLSAVMWFAYGLFQKDLCVALPNVLGFFLGLIQMLLYTIYRNAKTGMDENKLPEHSKNMAALGTPGAPDQVYPVNVHPDDVYGDDAGKDEKEKEPKQSDQCDKNNPDECPV